MKITTTHILPPIPDRSHDWLAEIDGQDEGPRGWGATEQEAIDDLRGQLNDEE